MTMAPACCSVMVYPSVVPLGPRPLFRQTSSCPRASSSRVLSGRCHHPECAPVCSSAASRQMRHVSLDVSMVAVVTLSSVFVSSGALSTAHAACLPQIPMATIVIWSRVRVGSDIAVAANMTSVPQRLNGRCVQARIHGHNATTNLQWYAFIKRATLLGRMPDDW